MKKLILIFIPIFICLQASASLSKKYETEISLQQKLQELLRQYDQFGQVIVNLEIREISTSLPNTGLKVSGLAITNQKSEIELTDIKSVSIQIFSHLDPFPEGLLELIKSSSGLPTGKVRISTRKYSSPQVQLHQKKVEMNDKLNEVLDSGVSFLRNGEMKLVLFFGAMVLFLGLVLFISFYGVSLSVKSWFLDGLDGFKRTEAKDVGGNFQQMNPAPMSFSQASIPPPARPLLSGERNQINELEINSLLALLGDCYWCEQDGYAKWIWSKLGHLKKVEILNSWDLADEYLRSIVSIEEASANYHEHPYYIHPLDLNHLSQGDLAAFVKEQPSSWHWISPLRQVFLPIDLVNRLDLSQSPRSAVTSWPEKPSAPRRLSQKFEVGTLTEADELRLMERPELLTEEIRHQTPSLVWLTLLNDEQIKQVFSRCNAQALAEAWVGPESLLKMLESHLPDKKREMVLELTQRVSPSRDSGGMSVLLELSETLRKETSEKKDESSDFIHDQAS